jgi:hypothetical protein
LLSPRLVRPRGFVEPSEIVGFELLFTCASLAIADAMRCHMAIIADLHGRGCGGSDKTVNEVRFGVSETCQFSCIVPHFRTIDAAACDCVKVQCFRAFRGAAGKD